MTRAAVQAARAVEAVQKHALPVLAAVVVLQHARLVLLWREIRRVDNHVAEQSWDIAGLQIRESRRGQGPDDYAQHRRR